MAVKNARTQQEYEAASDRAGRIKDLLASKGIQVGAVLGQQGVAEGGEKYKVKSIGHDAKGDYYISPSTGKKVYKSGVKVGDHENPKTGEHKGVAEEITADDMAQSAHMQGLNHGREGSGNNMDRAKAQHGKNFKHYNAGFLKGRNEKDKRLKVFGQGYNKKRPQPVAEGFNGEYDDEAGMAQSNLITTARAVMGLLKTIKDRDNLPEWGQEKIAKAEMMLVSVWDYLQSQKAMGNDPQQGVAEVFGKDKETGTTHKGGVVTKTAHGTIHAKTDYDDGHGEKGRKPSGEGPASRYTQTPILDKDDNMYEGEDPYFESLRARVEELAKK